MQCNILYGLSETKCVQRETVNFRIIKGVVAVSGYGHVSLPTARIWGMPFVPTSSNSSNDSHARFSNLGKNVIS